MRLTPNAHILRLPRLREMDYDRPCDSVGWYVRRAAEP